MGKLVRKIGGRMTLNSHVVWILICFSKTMSNSDTVEHNQIQTCIKKKRVNSLRWLPYFPNWIDDSKFISFNMNILKM